MFLIYLSNICHKGGNAGGISSPNFPVFVFHNFATLALDKLSPSCGAGRGAKFITGEAMASGRAQPPMQPILAQQIQIQDDHSCNNFLYNK